MEQVNKISIPSEAHTPSHHQPLPEADPQRVPDHPDQPDHQDRSNQPDHPDQKPPIDMFPA